MARQKLSNGVRSQVSPEGLLEVLACPRCKGEVILKSGRLDAYGFLFCSCCRQSYSINEGIPNVLPPELQSLSDAPEKDAALSIKEANMVMVRFIIRKALPLDAVLEKIPFVKTYGETSYILLQKP